MAYCNPLIQSNYRGGERGKKRGRKRERVSERERERERVEQRKGGRIKEEGGGDTKRQWSKEKGTRKQSYMYTNNKRKRIHTHTNQ